MEANFVFLECNSRTCYADRSLFQSFQQYAIFYRVHTSFLHSVRLWTSDIINIYPLLIFTSSIKASKLFITNSTNSYLYFKFVLGILTENLIYNVTCINWRWEWGTTGAAWQMLPPSDLYRIYYGKNFKNFYDLAFLLTRAAK